MIDFDKVFEEALAAYDEACGGQRCEHGPRWAALEIESGRGDHNATVALLLLTGMEVKAGEAWFLGPSRSVRINWSPDDDQGVAEALIAQHCGLAPPVFEEDA